jgi:predicted transcriptional regulator
VTTIKVPTELRDRLAREAARQGRTAAGLIAALLDDEDRRRRFVAVRDAYAHADAGYRDEVDEWDRLAGDGLGRD